MALCIRTFRVLLCAVLSIVVSCSDGSQSTPKNYLFVTDSIGVGVGSFSGYVEVLTISGVHQLDTAAFGSPEVLGGIERYKTAITELDIDTVWINVGLWDASDAFSPITPPEQYAANVEQIFQEFLGLGVQVIWCETAFTSRANLNEVIFELNVIADELAMEYGIPIFEMSYLQQVRGWQLSIDGTHFTNATTELVAREIEDFLRFR
jgi:lysophospholipase L1-like esterase